MENTEEGTFSHPPFLDDIVLAINLLSIKFPMNVISKIIFFSKLFFLILKSLFKTCSAHFVQLSFERKP